MRNNFLSKAYGGVTVARHKLNGLGLPRQWKVITSTLLLLFTFAIGNVLANQTELISGVTLPDVPASSLDMASQSAYTPDANGWIVFNPYSVTSTWWKVTKQSNQSATCDQSRLDALEPIAPFVPLTSGNAQKINYNGNYAAAVRFKGATNISFLVHPRSSKTFYVGLYSYNPSTSAQELIEEKSVSGNNANVIEYTGLTTSTEYIAYMYGKVSQNMSILELAIKAPVNTDGPFAVTYDKNNEGASGTMTDANSPYAKDATVTVLGNSFTAPTGMVFAGWNTKADGSGTSYAAGNTFDAVKDVTLYAQWAYPATGTGTITYTLTKGKADVSAEVSGVSTLSSSSTAFSVSTLAIGSSNSKDGYSGQITGHAADYSASQYVALQFTVADGYTFTPSAVSMKVFANSTSNMKMKLVFTDGVTSVESEELACASSADSDIEFASGAFTGKKFVGNVNVILYQWGVTSKRTYVKSPVTITGTVATAAPKYDVVFSNGGEGTGDMATLKYEAGEVVTLPACGYTPVAGREFDGWTSSDVTISAGKFTMPSNDVTITATWRDEAVKYTVTYDVNGGSSATPTETAKAAGDEFALAAAPEYEGYHFEGWLCDADAATYDAEDAYTMTAANTKFTAQWKPYSTISIANKTYIIGSGNFNAVSDFSSNCEAAVIYELKESYSGVTLTPAGVFSATAAGEYIVVANQAGDATYAATSKEFTVTVLDNELSDTYVWKKNASYTGCIANPNADAPAAQYTDIAYEGFTGMGRAAADNTECILTFTVKAAYSATFGIKSICTYGKLEEPAGGQISWDGGANWEDLAAYAEGKKEFNAPAATFPTSFKIRFLGVSASSGGLYWRNALVTLEAKKTVSCVTEALVGAEVNGAAISSENLATLLEDKTLDIATAYAAAPTVTFKKQVTTTYEGGWAPDVTNVDVEVTASDNTTAWQASATINEQAYTINIAKPAGPSLESEATAFTLTSAKIATDTKSFTFSGINLAHNVTIALESDVAGLSVTPAVVVPIENAITDQEVTITYKSLENVAEAMVNLVVAYDVDTKITIPLTYSSTAGFEDLTPISAATTWNWTNAADAEYGTLGQSDIIVLANADAVWDEGFDARAIAGALQYYYRGNSYAQGNSLKFNTTIPGKVYVKFSNTGSKDIARAPRITDVNGTYAPEDESEGSKNTTAKWYNHSVAAGDVLIEGFEMKEPIALNMLRYYEVRFAPIFSVTYDAGEGSVKGGETIPTQADEAAGEKIVLAAATALEKDGYDFAGWLCNIDAQTYQPGDEYTMTAAATTFTAQWVLHVDPVDPTLTYNEGAYMVGASALDLSTLISVSNSTGAITYSVKDAGTTGATITDGKFTATAAGTAIITASQAAVLGYNAITVDFDVVVTEATEIDGIKLVETGALTGNFITGSSLSNGEYTIEGIHYEKYLKFGSAFSGSYGNGARTNYIFYDLKKENTTFYVYAHNNTSTAGKIIVYTYNTASAKYAEVPVAASENAIKSFSLNDIDANTRVFIGVDNTNIYFCQVVAVESGADLMKGGQAGYSIDFSAKSRFSGASGAAITLDGMEFVTSSGYTPNSSTEVSLGAIGTNYVKFVLDTKTLVEVKTNSTNQYYIGSTYAAEVETSKTYGYKPAAAGETHSFELEAGTWYLNPNTSNIKLQKLAFMLPKCAEPSFDALANSDICEGDPYVALDGTATITDAGTVTYKWYAEGADESDPAAVLGTDATYTPSTDGKYYVIATNNLSGYSDNVKKSDLVSVTHFASAEITTAPAIQCKETGQLATLTVVATGKAPLTYQWYTCDDEAGSNPVIIEGADEATYEVTVTVGMSQYYKVVVGSGCGSAEAVTLVEEWHEVAPANVTGSRTWDWAAENMGTIETVSGSTEYLMANVSSQVPNTEAFRSDMLYITANYANRSASNKFFQGWQIRFYTEVPGKVSLNCRAIHGTMSITINGTVIDDAKGSDMGTATTPFFVPAGWVTIVFDNQSSGYEGEAARVQKIIFNATPDYTRTEMLGAGVYGTICVDHNVPEGGVRGVTVYEIAGREPQYGKIAFDEVTEMAAGVPYVFIAHGNEMALYYGETTVDDPVNGNGMYGTFEDQTLTELDGIYYFAQKALWSCVDLNSLSLPANRAYVKLSEIDYLGSSSPAPGRKRLLIGVNGAPAVATGFENVQGDNVQCTKVLINGQLFILRGEKMYDAKGQLVK